ncbi:MAG: hypothetical protein C4K47_06270 [Candidatus Thorarchaeota archaeon]|nr:MAG: hypothetical protein C4K47_06270 [Candidatus Thorarchaeota archaeon]
MRFVFALNTISLIFPEMIPDGTLRNRAVGPKIRLHSSMEKRDIMRHTAFLPIHMSEDQHLDDKKIQKIRADIEQFKSELKKAEADLSSTGPQVTAEMERYKAAAKAKRDAADSIRAKQAQAEKEWHDADRLYRQVEGTKGKELDSTKKRVEQLRSRIRDAEKARQNRIAEIEKEKLKLVEKAKKEKAKEMDRRKTEEVAKVEDQTKKEVGLKR